MPCRHHDDTAAPPAAPAAAAIAPGELAGVVRDALARRGHRPRHPGVHGADEARAADLLLTALGITGEGPALAQSVIAVLRLQDAGHGGAALGALTTVAHARAVPVDDLTEPAARHRIETTCRREPRHDTGGRCPEPIATPAPADGSAGYQDAITP